MQQDLRTKRDSASSALEGKKPTLLSVASVLGLYIPLSRLAKKEADREKLAAEFPLLFNNKTVGNKVTNSNVALNKSATIVTPSKRKSTYLDKNDENCSLAANKIAAKSTPGGGKTPLSSKKPRKGSLMMSPKAQSHQVAGLSKTLPALPTYRPQSARSSTSTSSAPVTENASGASAQSELPSVDADVDAAPAGPVEVPQSAIKPDPAQEGVELLALPSKGKGKGLFADPELEEMTSASGRSSLSSLGESVAPAACAQETASADCDQEETAVEAAVAEQVQDALDYLLELDELDAQTYRRVSSTRFSARDIKRLSLATAPLVSDAAPAGAPPGGAEAPPAEHVEGTSRSAHCSGYPVLTASAPPPASLTRRGPGHRSGVQPQQHKCQRCDGAGLPGQRHCRGGAGLRGGRGGRAHSPAQLPRHHRPAAAGR